MTARIHGFFREYSSYIVLAVTLLFVLSMAWFRGEVKAVVRDEIQSIDFPYSRDSSRVQLQIKTIDDGLKELKRDQSEGFKSVNDRLDRLLRR